MNAHSQPRAMYLENEDAVVFVTQDSPHQDKPVSIYITTLIDPETKHTIGVRFTDFRTIAQNLAFNGKFSFHKPIPLRTILVYAIRMSRMPLKHQISTIFELRHLILSAALSVEQMEAISLIAPI
jgi:hypothetical protein